MSTVALPVALPKGHYRFRHVARMEWIKLRSLRSTWWTLAVTIAASIGIGLTVGLKTKDASNDITNNVLAGVAIGLLLTGVLGVLVMTSEYSSGMIRGTLAVSPSRSKLLAAKAVVFGAMALVVGEIAAFTSFLVGSAAIPSDITSPSLGDPGVLRAVILAGTGYCLVGLIGLGLGALIRHTPAAVAVLVGGVYVGAEIVAAVSTAVRDYIPFSIEANSLTTVQHLDGAPTPWVGLLIMCLYAAVVLAAGGLSLAWRDA
jgi:hypothetical protein